MSEQQTLPVSGTFGKLSEHLTVKQLLHFRAASALLSWSNSLDASKGTTNNPNPEADYAPHYDRLNHFVNLQVRHTEVAAATISDQRGNIFRTTIQILDEDEDEELTDTEERHHDKEDKEPITVSRNFARDQDQSSRQKLYDGDTADARNPQRHAPLIISLEDATPSPDIQDSKLGYWLLDHTEGAAKRGKFPKTNISFATHSANIIHLIKDSHDAQGVERITRAQERLQNYVILTCCAKMFGRLARGVDDRDLYDYITITSGDLAEKMVGSNLTELLHICGLTHVCRPLTTHERSTISRLCNFVLAHLRRDVSKHSPGNGGDEQEKEHYAAKQFADDMIIELNHFSIAVDDQTSPVQYDTSILLRLQILISVIVRNVNRSLSDLAQFKRKAQIHKQNHAAEWPVGPSNDVPFSTNIEALNNAVEDAGAWLRGLSELMGHLGPLVQANLACIAIKFQLKSVRRKTEEINDDLSRNKADEAPFTSSPRLSSVAGGGGEPGNESVDKEIWNRTEEKDHYYPEFKFVDGIKWEHAASTWLQLLCLHTFAYMALTRNIEGTSEDRATAELFRRTELNIIKSSSEFIDQQLYISDFLDDFTYTRAMKATKFDDEEKSFIYSWLERSGYGYSKKVLAETKAQKSLTGTYHCETLLICLYLVGKMRADIVDPGIDKVDVSSDVFHLLLPDQNITDKVVDALDVLSVTKRCCPACHSLVEFFVKEARFKPRMLYAGSHSEWSQVALPPFIPKAAGEYVIQAAKRALQPRLLEMIDIMKNDASPKTQRSLKSAASATSKPLSFDSSPLPPVPAFVQPTGMEDTAHPDYMWPEKKRGHNLSSPASTSRSRHTKKIKVNESSPTPKTGYAESSGG